MSVGFKSPLSSANTNAAFVSKLVDSTSVGKLTLNKVSEGAQVASVQASINDHETRIDTLESTPAFVNPTTTKGDLIVDDGTDAQRLGVGLNSYVLTADTTQALGVKWAPSTGGGGGTNFAVDNFSGNNVTTAFVLSQDPFTENNLGVFISGVYQQKNTFSLSGTTITFSTAPPAGANNIEVVIGNGGGSVNYAINNFSGNNVTTAFVLSQDPGLESNVNVFISGVYQQKDTFSVSGTTITFSTAPPTGTNNVEAIVGKSVQLNIPADLSVSAAKIVDSSVTRAKQAAVGQQVSGSSGSFSTTSGSAVDVTNLSVAITTTGRPVCLALIGNGVSLASVRVFSTSGTNVSGLINFLRDAAVISSQLLQNIVSGNGANSLGLDAPPGSFACIDIVAAGTYTYKVQTTKLAGTSIAFNSIKLIAYEL